MGRAHGVRGEVMVTPLSDNPERFAPGAVLLVGPDAGRAEPRRVLAARPQAGRLAVHFEGSAGRPDAEALTGSLVFVESGEIPAAEPGAFWPHEIVGLAVHDPEGRLLGTVAAVHPRPAQDLWEVATPQGPVLLPAVKEIVRSVDRPAGVVVVDPPAGLFGGA